MTRILLFLVLINVVHSKLKWDLLSANNGSASFPGPAPRRDSSIGYDRKGKQLIVFGGKGDDGLFNDTWIFDLANRFWTKIDTGSGSTPEKRFSMVFGAADDSFYISTGEGTEPRRFFNDIWQYKFTNETWERLDDPKVAVQPEERYGSAGGIFDDGKSGNGFYITHGFSGTRYSNTFRFDLTTKEWQEKFHGSNSYNPSYPHSRCLHSGTLTKPDELVIYGGCLGGGGTGGPCPAEDSWKFDATKTEWTRLEECSTPRIYSAMAMLPPLNDTSVRRAVMYGGGETSKSVLVTPEVEANEIAVFDPDTNKWQRKKVEDTAPIKRSSHVMVTTDDGIVVFGGSGDGSFLNDLWLLNGTASDADDLESAGSCGSADFNLIMLHGIFMFLGWGVFLQLGAFIARYFRHKADGWWFKMHRIFQVTGLVFAFAGLICGIVSVPSGHFRFAHAPIGLVIMIIGLTQPLNAFFRPHKHEDGSRSTTRLVWELFHKNIGRVGLILALINISLGLFLAVVPTAAWAVWYALLGTFVCVYIVMEIRLQISHRKKNTVAFPLQGK